MVVRFPAGGAISVSKDNITTIDSKLLNSYRSSIVSIQTELGIQPSGMHGTIKGRLDNVDQKISSILLSIEDPMVFVATGDLTGSPTIQTVIGLQGVPVASATPANGNALVYNQSLNQWEPQSFTATFTPGGDLSGTSLLQTVVGLQGIGISSSAPDDGYFLKYNQLYNQWQPALAPSGSFSAGGDLSGTSSSQTVIKINGISLSGTPSSGQVLTATSPITATWQNPSSPYSNAITGNYSCDAGVSVNDVVYVSSADTVAKADSDNISAQPLIGLVLDKPTSTTAVVIYYGEISGFSSLSVGETYYLSTNPGQITNIAPSSMGSIVQRVGFAKNSTTLVVMIDRDYIVI